MSIGSVVKNLPIMQETWVQSLGWKDLLEKGMATHSRTLAWKSHGWRSLIGYNPWGHKRVRYDLVTKQHQRSITHPGNYKDLGLEE